MSETNTQTHVTRSSADDQTIALQNLQTTVLQLQNDLKKSKESHARKEKDFNEERQKLMTEINQLKSGHSSNSTQVSLSTATTATTVISSPIMSTTSGGISDAQSMHMNREDNLDALMNAFMNNHTFWEKICDKITETQKSRTPSPSEQDIGDSVSQRLRRTSNVSNDSLNSSVKSTTSKELNKTN